jgi:hypothetical protein
MNKTIVYIAVLGFLGFGVYYSLFRHSDGLYSEKDANFTIVDTASIQRIFMVQNDGQSVLLERSAIPGKWTVNKKYEAMSLQLYNLLTCLYKQTAFAPVSEKDHDRVIKLLAGISVKVEVYNKKGDKIRVFYVGGEGPNYHGSFMMMEGSSTPYLVEVPGFKGYLSPRFSTEVKDWRSRLVFNLKPDSIKSVKIDYEGEPLSSFLLKKDKEKIDVVLDPQMQGTVKNINKHRTDDYITFFENINCEGYLNGSNDMGSSIQKNNKRCSVALTSTSGHIDMIDFYWMNINKRSKNMNQDTAIQTNKYDGDRMYAINTVTNDTMLVQFRTFEKLFRRGYEFYSPDNVNNPVKNESRPSPIVPRPTAPYKIK